MNIVRFKRILWFSAACMFVISLLIERKQYKMALAVTVGVMILLIWASQLLEKESMQ